MKLTVISILISVAMIPLLKAQDQSGELKVGIARVNYILMKLPQMKEIEAQLKEFEEQLQKLYISKMEAYDVRYKEYMEGKDSMLDIIRRDFEMDLRQMKESIENFESEAQISIIQKQNILLKPVQKKVFDSIEEIADQLSYTLILNYDIEGIPIVLHHHDSLDISDLVLSKLGVPPE